MTALIAVHVLIIAHIIHWQIAGTTVGSVQLTEAMRTLELGEVNPAFVLFAAAIGVTLVAGRFFCGWACHMGALQDASLWLMRRCGLRPKPFRARLLPWIPTGLAVYMFVWPTFKRLVVFPVLNRAWPGSAAWLDPVPPLNGFSFDLTTNELWGSLPTWLVAIPFLLVCGVAAVYFLGARGFCAYGCPYGGLFRPVENLAPVRIAVDPELCDRCGLCTAGCTSNVRVLDEITAHGSVFSSNCIRSLDCVSICPQNALALRAVRPPAFQAACSATRPAAAPDLTWREEVVLLSLFIVLIVMLRGAYGVVPLLFAVGLAACLTFLYWKAWRLLRDRDVRLHGWQLRRRGRLKARGVGFLAGLMIASALVVQAGLVKMAGWQAGRWDRQVTVDRSTVLDGSRASIEPQQVEHARLALCWYERAGSWRQGGFGLADTPRYELRAAWLALVVGNVDDAIEAMERVIRREGASDQLVADLARIRLRHGDPQLGRDLLRVTLRRHPRWKQCRNVLIDDLLRRNRPSEALQHVDRALDVDPKNVALLRLGAHLDRTLQRLPQAADRLTAAISQQPGNAGLRHARASVRFEMGDLPRALSDLDLAALAEPERAAAFFEQGAAWLAAAGRDDEAVTWKRRAETAGE